MSLHQYVIVSASGGDFYSDQALEPVAKVSGVTLEYDEKKVCVCLYISLGVIFVMFILFMSLVFLYGPSHSLAYKGFWCLYTPRYCVHCV